MNQFNTQANFVKPFFEFFPFPGGKRGPLSASDSIKVYVHYAPME